LLLSSAATASKDALYPKTEEEFAGIIIPNEWKPMEPLTKSSKSYRLVKWGTVVILCVLAVLLVLVVMTDWLGESFFTLAYIFFILINSVRHSGNLFILPKGIILNGKLVFYHQIKDCETEQIIRWHPLYGLDDKVNNAYKLTFRLKRTLFQPQFIVVQTAAQLEQIITLLNQRGVRCYKQLPEQKERAPYV
jgi:hypothetical protein